MTFITAKLIANCCITVLLQTRKFNAKSKNSAKLLNPNPVGVAAVYTESLLLIINSQRLVKMV